MRSFNELLQSPRALKALVAGGSALGLLLLGLLTAPAFVRGKVEREARQRGLEAHVDDVELGLGRVWLKGVALTMPGEDVELRLEAVEVGLFSKAVRATGGALRGNGDPARLVDKLRAKTGSEAGEASPGAGGRELGVDGLALRWQYEGVLVEAAGVRAARRESRLTFGADSAHVSGGKADISVRNLELTAVSSQGHRQLERLAVSALVLALESDEPKPSASGKAAVSARAPPRAGVGARGAEAGARGAEAASGGPPELEADEPAAEQARASRAARLRQVTAVLRPLARELLADGAHLALDGVAARIQRSGELLSFGPSRLSLTREHESLRVSLTPSAVEAGTTPLALSGALPLGSGPLHVVVQGGPVSLSSLGVRNGQLGLREVERATLAADGVLDFTEDFESVELDGRLAVRSLELSRPELSPQPVGPWSFDTALKGRARLDGSELSVLSSEAQLGEVRTELSGMALTTPGNRRVQGRLRVPLSGCQSLLEAIPHGLLPQVSGLTLSGSFGIDLQVRYDQLKPADTSVVLAVKNECRVRDVPLELSPHRFERPFLREVKAPDGSPMSIESGPGTQSWVSLDDISRHMESAILICEDAGFYSHAGFDFRALENAIKDDLKQGRFARGASTVSMQLAKNLYLGKEKTLGRKLQEALLTMLLEQQLDKRRILELYLNVVELGPGLYGVGDAAQYYFATPARALTLGQSLYLASLLPNPTYSRFGPDGRLRPGWLGYIHKLMHIARKIRRIDDSELQAGLEEEIAFRVPGAPVAPASTPNDGPDPSEAPGAPELGPE